MNIVVVGAGAIGSLFGGLLSNHHQVTLLGRTPHVKAIQKHQLSISGTTNLSVSVPAVDTITDLKSPDVLLLCVKSYDTQAALQQVQPLCSTKTTLCTLQNGLSHIDIIKKFVAPESIIVGCTTHGAIFSQPGHIVHTAKGHTLLGALDGSEPARLTQLVTIFTKAGIPTTLSHTILEELWKKAIVNSSINPLTAVFQCKNGYLQTNPILQKMVTLICHESTKIAQASGFSVTATEALQKTHEVITTTKDNESSMLQSIQHHKPTEIDAINGFLARRADDKKIDATLNHLLVTIINGLE